MNSIAVFDLDGVLFDPSVRKLVYETAVMLTPERANERYARGHYYQYDKVIPNSLETVLSYQKMGFDIAYLSGRRASSQEATMKILLEKGFPVGSLYLKPQPTDDTETHKREILEDLVNQYEEVMFFDDLEENRLIGESLGIRCFESCDSVSFF